MKLLYLPLAIILYLVPAILSADPVEKIADLVRQGNIHELAKLFSSSIEIGILNEESIYSKTQGELVLTKFFTQNKPVTVKILHKINSNPAYRFGVLTIVTEKGIFRMAFTLKGADNDLSLIDMHVDVEKIK